MSLPVVIFISISLSPLLPHPLHPLHLCTHVISPFNFTYLELAADSLKYPAVHSRYALIHRWTDTLFVCVWPGDGGVVEGMDGQKAFMLSCVCVKMATDGDCYVSEDLFNEGCTVNFFLSKQSLHGNVNIVLLTTNAVPFMLINCLLY